MSASREIRLRRLKVWSWRRGIKEMDLILGRFWDAKGDGLDDAALDLYEDLLAENDQELFSWINGQNKAPKRFEGLIALLREE